MRCGKSVQMLELCFKIEVCWLYQPKIRGMLVLDICWLLDITFACVHTRSYINITFKTSININTWPYHYYDPLRLESLVCWYPRLCSRLQLKCDGTRWRTGGEMKGKLANAAGSQYPSHGLGTWCIQHYYRWCAHLSCQMSTELTPPPI